jgi:hypothetical protein
LASRRPPRRDLRTERPVPSAAAPARFEHDGQTDERREE